MTNNIYLQLMLRGWTSGITIRHFSQALHYEDATEGATPCFNGNISKMTWSGIESVLSDTPISQWYNYTYDNLNRLTSANYGTDSEDEILGALALEKQMVYRIAKLMQ